MRSSTAPQLRTRNLSNIFCFTFVIFCKARFIYKTLNSFGCQENISSWFCNVFSFFGYIFLKIINESSYLLENIGLNKWQIENVSRELYLLFLLLEKHIFYKTQRQFRKSNVWAFLN